MTTPSTSPTRPSAPNPPSSQGHSHSHSHSHSHAHDLQRRRDRTAERARFHHLSRTLQTRLQYARLKVEHGWVRPLSPPLPRNHFSMRHAHPLGRQNKR
ncbi:hypothetical protein CALCODRAFT_493784 [Calocera cornea HHB12733]|uniref:Uncharacterized protein n=1 Tax=Calocera cornea HHB12733 TaxID=1353952 RepID=A0A165HFR3_9BASI|nr:hypothetical protein CALCODRAFT_493784 [Calocera cornea HHB12733]